MLRFLRRRLISMVFVLIGISLMVFILGNLVPRDPAAAALGPRATEEQIQKLRVKLGLDRPLWEQYLRYVSRLLTGDLGDSIMTRRPVAKDLAVYFPASLELTLAAFFICVVAGYPLGVLAASHPGGAIDRLIHALAMIGVAIPVFWIGIVLQLVFYRQLGLLPAEGQVPVYGVEMPPPVTHMLIVDSILAGQGKTLLVALQHLILPATALALPNLAYVTKLVRVRVMETLTEDYIRTARSKGLRERSVLIGHAVPNALLPAVTMTAMLVGAMLGGAVLVEIIFNWPGMGLYAVRAIQAADLVPVLDVTLIIALVYMASNLFVDFLYTVLDPRIRYG
jgi:peptide/nickel transport system permease protein